MMLDCIAAKVDRHAALSSRCSKVEVFMTTSRIRFLLVGVLPFVLGAHCGSTREPSSRSAARLLDESLTRLARSKSQWPEELAFLEHQFDRLEPNELSGEVGR